jgi:hypothetical protein
MPGTALVLIVSYLMAKSTPWEMQRSVEPVSKKSSGCLPTTTRHNDSVASHYSAATWIHGLWHPWHG